VFLVLLIWKDRGGEVAAAPWETLQNNHEMLRTAYSPQLQRIAEQNRLPNLAWLPSKSELCSPFALRLLWVLCKHFLWSRVPLKRRKISTCLGRLQRLIPLFHISYLRISYHQSTVILTLWRLNFFEITYKNSVRTSQKTHYVFTTKPNRLMLFRETVFVYCENHTEQRQDMVLMQQVNRSWIKFSSGTWRRVVC
jgi:hypothetical protein